MDYKETIREAAQALRRNVLRTSLTMLGIIIGITAVILIYSIGQGAVRFITDELSSFGTDYFQINPGSTQVSTFAGSEALTFDDLDAIKNDSSLTNINYVAPIAMASETITANGEEDELLIYGITHEILDILKPEVIEGEFITEDQEISSERVAVLGADVAEKFFGEDTAIVGETIKINNSLYIPIDVVINQIIGEERLQEIDISVHDSNTINQTIADVEALLRDRHNLDEDDENDFQIQSAQDILNTVETITSLLTAMIVAISGISLIVGGVGVMNIMLVSVTERTREIGLLKSIGAKEKDILTQFLVESMVMTLAGGVIGIILGVAGAFFVSLAFKIPFVVSVPAIVIAAGVSMLVGIVFGLYPARRAARLSPIDALRYE